METQTVTKQISNHALAAKQIRTQLKEKFPQTKFSVRSKTFSGGDSIDISWENGPSNEQVEQITNKHQYGHFDGMIDLYEYSNVREDVAQSKYVFAQRTLTDEMQLRLGKVIAKDYGYTIPNKAEDLSRDIKVNERFDCLYSMIYRYAKKLDLTNKTSIEHKTPYCGTEDGCYDAI